MSVYPDTGLAYDRAMADDPRMADPHYRKVVERILRIEVKCATEHPEDRVLYRQRREEHIKWLNFTLDTIG